MAHIFLTRKCNLKCSYCFADEFVNKENEEFEFDNLKRVIDFIKTDKNERIGLIGGEPTLYSRFKEVLEILNNDNDIFKYIIFTNGIEIDKYIDYIANNKAQILINCNSKQDIGNRYEQLKNNIMLLKEKNLLNFMLGINLYSKSFDYSFIFELLKITGQHQLRFSTSLPNSDKEENANALEMFESFIPYLFCFFNDCYNNNIIPYSDCNGIPHCLLNSEQKKLLVKIKQKADKYRLPNTIISTQNCTPVIDIMPDMKAVRCFGLSKYLKVPIDNFKTIDDLKAYFYQKIDVYANLSYSSEECDKCASRLYNKCSICFTYKTKQINLLKQFILKNLP